MINRIRRFWTTPAAPIASAIYPDDLFLVSFPKSGNTWMRFLLANLLTGPGGDTVDFHAAVDWVPEYERHHEQVARAARPRILKSHATRTDTFPCVVYLVRDPRDVYVSYYHYLLKQLPEGTTLSDFIRSDTLYPCHWRDHVGHWIERDRLLVVRYEDMLADTAEELRRVLRFWGKRSFDDAAIANAVEASAFGKMQQLEAERGRPFVDERHRATANTFMRRGQRGDWVNHLSPEDDAYLRETAGELMQRLGYATARPAAA